MARFGFRLFGSIPKRRKNATIPSQAEFLEVRALLSGAVPGPMDGSADVDSEEQGLELPDPTELDSMPGAESPDEIPELPLPDDCSDSECADTIPVVSLLSVDDEAAEPPGLSNTARIKVVLNVPAPRTFAVFIGLSGSAKYRNSTSPTPSDFETTELGSFEFPPVSTPPFALRGSVRFDPGEQEKVIEITANDDGIFNEGKETVQFEIEDSSTKYTPATIPDQRRASVDIWDHAIVKEVRAIGGFKTSLANSRIDNLGRPIKLLQGDQIQLKAIPSNGGVFDLAEPLWSHPDLETEVGESAGFTFEQFNSTQDITITDARGDISIPVTLVPAISGIKPSNTTVTARYGYGTDFLADLEFTNGADSYDFNAAQAHYQLVSGTITHRNSSTTSMTDGTLSSRYKFSLFLQATDFNYQHGIPKPGTYPLKTAWNYRPINLDSSSDRKTLEIDDTPVNIQVGITTAGALLIRTKYKTAYTDEFHSGATSQLGPGGTLITLGGTKTVTVVGSVKAGSVHSVEVVDQDLFSTTVLANIRVLIPYVAGVMNRSTKYTFVKTFTLSNSGGTVVGPLQSTDEKDPVLFFNLYKLPLTGAAIPLGQSTTAQFFAAQPSK